MRKTNFILCISLILLLSGCANLNRLDSYLEPTKTNSECEQYAKSLMPPLLGTHYTKVSGLSKDHAYYLTHFYWNDNSSFGRESSSYNDALREFYKGYKEGQNINYLYSKEACRPTPERVCISHFNTEPLAYSKKIIKKDIVLGTTHFEIDNLILKEVSDYPNLNFSINNKLLNLDKYFTAGFGITNGLKKIVIREEVNTPMIKSVREGDKYDHIFKNSLMNLIRESKNEKFVLEFPNFELSKEESLELLKQYDARISAYRFSITDFKRVSGTPYEILEMEVLNCNLVK